LVKACEVVDKFVVVDCVDDDDDEAEDTFWRMMHKM
jgi:hypothetical protein